MFFADKEERINHHCSLCRFVAAGEQVVFPSQCNWSYSILDEIIHLPSPLITRNASANRSSLTVD